MDAKKVEHRVPRSEDTHREECFMFHGHKNSQTQSSQRGLELQYITDDRNKNGYVKYLTRIDSEMCAPCCD